MKPVRLTMSAFGPYASEVSVDFTAFEGQGLFLITGQTGSGKTTIYDGISYALFGQPSGEYRSSRHLRSDYADESTETFVEFTFEHLGHTYSVRRTPAYERRKKRGEGTRQIPETASLSKDGGVPAEGLVAVNDRISVLLGVSYKQFKQIAMIAQGEFYSLLNASTDDRTKILRSIFMTEGYKQLEKKLKVYCDESKTARDSARSSIIQYFSDVRVDENNDDQAYSALRDRYSQLKQNAQVTESAWNTDDMLETVSDLTDEDSMAADQLKELASAKDKDTAAANERLITAQENNRKIMRLKECEENLRILEGLDPQVRSEKNAYDRRRKASHDLSPVYREYTSQTLRVRNAEDAAAAAQKKSEAARAKASGCSEIAEKAETEEPKASECEALALQIKKDEKDYGLREELNAQILQLSGSSEKARGALEAASQRKTALNKVIDEAGAVREKLKDSPVKAAEKKNETERLKRLHAIIRPLVSDRFEEYERLSAQCRNAQGKYIASRADYDEALRQSEEAEKILEYCRAGLLAQSLEEGRPCPVCGSVHHPQKAALPKHFVTEDEVKALKEITENARNISDSNNKTAAQMKTLLEAVEQQLGVDLEEVLSDELVIELSGKIPGENSGETPDAFGNEDRSHELIVNPGETEHESAEANADENGADVMQTAVEKTRYTADAIKDMVDRAREAESTLTQRLSDAEREYGKLVSDSARLRLAEENLKKAEDDRTKEESAINEFTENIRKISEKLSEAKGKADALKKLDYPDWKTAQRQMSLLNARASSIRRNISSARQRRKEADEEAAACAAALKAACETRDREQKKLTENREALDAALEKNGYNSDEELKKDIVPEEELNRMSARIQKHFQKKAAAEAQLEQAKKDAEGKETEDVQALQEIYLKLKSETEELHSRQTMARGRADINRKIIENIAKRKSDHESAIKKYNTALRLYNLVTGQTGKGRITFEQYAQAAGFDSIIRAANRRLQRISDGQYELFRQQDSVGKRTNTFLDLEVLDNHTGRRRPVNTLSGGESFDASLSLALGLSDTVSSNLGGIRMDALFVDEGFGTLDADSIGRVLNTLTGLSGSGKLVGVISHREELAEAIPQKIVVEKGPDGSSLRTELAL